MKEIQFYAIISAIAAAESLLILTGILPPLSSYSIGQILFSFAQLAVVVRMGWSSAKLGLEKVAVKGAKIGLVFMANIAVFSLIGYLSGTALLGVTVPSAVGLLLILLSMTIMNVITFAIFAVVGMSFALKLKK